MNKGGGIPIERANAWSFCGLEADLETPTLLRLMKKTLYRIGLVLCLALGIGSALSVEAAQVEASQEEAQQDWEFWFPVGETIHYNLFWGVIPVANSTATAEWVEWEGRQMLSITFRTKSNAFLSRIYPVDDHLEAIIEPETFLPVKFRKQFNQGRYSTDQTTLFDHANRTATWIHNVRNSTNEFEIAEDTRDLITFMYYMRTQEFDVGQNHDFQVMADEKIYDLNLRAHRREEIELERYGNVESIEIEPTAEFEGLFVRRGKMTVWVSEDERRLLTQASINVPVGNVHVKLHEVTGPGDDFWLDPQDPSRRRRGRRRSRR